MLDTPPKKPEFVLQEHPLIIRWLDSLQNAEAKKSPVYTYNANFLSDYQAYMLGMAPEEIDRMFAYRAAGNWINSEEEFWTVTGVTDSRRNTISLRLRFAKNKESRIALRERKKLDDKPVLADINKATVSDLMKVRGIGPVLSRRIVKFRDRLGGFQVKEQLLDVYGLDREVVKRMFKLYMVKERPLIKLININEASMEEIASLIYLKKELAYRIVMYRQQHGPFENLEELTKIEDFPADKIGRITLYLSL